MYVLIVNPLAGTGKAIYYARQINQTLNQRNIPHQTYVTSVAGEEEYLLQEALQSHGGNLIVIGGDGTLHKTVNALMKQPAEQRMNRSVGVIPAGTGNDWCRHHGIPSHPMKALEVILKGKTMIHDVGRIQSGDHTAYFINMAGTGFQSHVIKHTVKNRRWRHIPYFYYLKALSHLAGYHASEMTLCSEELNLYQAPVFMVAVANCRYHGGGMKQAPAALPDDGWLDVTIISRMSLVSLLMNIPLLLSGRHIHHPSVMTFRTRELTIDSPLALYAEADGEILTPSPFSFSIIHQAIKMIVP
jgi:YegS/Rv2252/BmrU family lipid kinase